MTATVFSPFATGQDRDDRELTVSDARLCADEVERKVMASFTAKKRPLESLVRDWMIENAQGTPTTRAELEEAVRRLLDLRHGL